VETALAQAVTTPEGGEDWVPRPDPTRLTTEALMREIAALKELVGASIAGVKELHTYDVAGLRDSIRERFTRFEEELERSDALRNEKFRSIETQLKMMERYRLENKEDTRAAVDAALSAAEKAVREQNLANDRSITKSETAVTEQLKQLNLTFSTAIDGIRRELSALTTKVTSLESVRLGVKENVSNVYAGVAMIVTLGLLAVGVLTYFANR